MRFILRSVLTAIVLLAPVGAAPIQHHIVFGRIGPMHSQLFIANADGTGERALLPLTGLDYSPSLSSDGRWVVFTSERNGSADIYRVLKDGSSLERLTDDPAYDDQAVLSPDGTTLAFVSSRVTGKAHIWLMDLITKKSRVLTNGSGGDFRPAWSPDGQWVAFTSDRDSNAGNLPGRWEHLQSTKLYVVHPDGSGLKALTNGRGVVGTPRWSRDSKRLTYYETTSVGAWYAQRGDATQGLTNIVSIDIVTNFVKQHTTGSGVRLWGQELSDGRVAYLTKYPSGDADLRLGDAQPVLRGQIRNPSWSADGSQVVFHKIIGENNGFEMMSTFSRNDDFRLTMLSRAIFPAFSPDGQRIALGVYHNGPNDSSLEVMNADGSNRKSIFYRQGAAAFAPEWSPDGKRIAFSLGLYFRALGHPSAQVGLINADGSDFRTIASDDANNGFPSWSPDGTHIVYKKDSRLVVLSLADNSLRNLTEPGPQHDNFPQWSSKGDWIAFTSDRGADGDFRIYLIRPDGTQLHNLTETPGDGHCVWSPDGEWVMFSSARMGFKDERALLEEIPQPYGELFIVRPNGKDLKQLTDNQWEDATPSWMPEVGSQQRSSR